jgi:hypothetical protein
MRTKTTIRGDNHRCNFRSDWRPGDPQLYPSARHAVDEALLECLPGRTCGRHFGFSAATRS